MRWEDWETLLPELIEFAKGEIRRRKWRGSRSGASVGGWDDGQVRDKVRKETESRITEALRGGDQAVEKLFGCLRAGVVKRREIAARLGMSVTEVTNCRKRLDRMLEELEKAGCARWAIEEWKRK